MQKKKGGTSVKGYEETKKSGTNEPELGIKHEKKKTTTPKRASIPPTVAQQSSFLFPSFYSFAPLIGSRLIS